MNGKLFSARKFLSQCAVVGVLAFVIGANVAHADWPSYRGPLGNGASTEKNWNAQFPADGPKVLWRADFGTGISAVTISGGRAYSMGNVDGADVIYCLDASTGREQWRHKFPLKLDDNMFEGGPRSTPTVDGDRVYTVSHEGDLWCLNATTGKPIWYHHYQKDFNGRRPSWGYAGSPLVTGKMVVCDVGAENGSTVALDKETGATIWKAGADKAGYASPVEATVDGKSVIVVLKADSLVGCDVKDGHELWRGKWKTDYDVNAATPLVVSNNRILVSSGYNAGCILYEITGSEAKELWRNKNLRAHINSPVALQGFVYGIDGNANGGELVCLDLANGQRKWQDKSVKGGSLISANGKLIILTEKGELITGDASPEGFHPISRAQIFDKRCWVQPTLASGKLYVKDNFGEARCLSLGAN